MQFSAGESDSGRANDGLKLAAPVAVQPTQRQFSDSESDSTASMSPRSPIKGAASPSKSSSGHPSPHPSPGGRLSLRSPSTGSISGMGAAQEAKDYLQVNVVDYFCEGSGQFYNHHYYVCNVLVEGLHWQVDRCILDFVELDRKLRKRYPRCTFMPLPISASSLQALYVELERSDKLQLHAQQQKQQQEQLASAEYSDQPMSTASSGGVGSVGASLLSSAEGFFGGWGSSARHQSLSLEGTSAIGGRSASVSTLEVNNVDHMSNKADALNKYLQSVMQQHELLVAEELSLFLDQEAATMSTQVAKLEPLSTHDILLLNEPQYKCIVRKREEVTVTVTNNQILIWRFHTQDYDIAFSADLNGETKVSYTRYNSHLSPVCGVLLVDDVVSTGGYLPGESPLVTDSPGKAHAGKYRGRLESNSSRCSLIFDNSYAKLHTKKLTWAARVVSIEQYHEAKEQAMECQKERRQFEFQRHAFRKIAIRIAASRSGVIHHTSSVVTDYIEEEVLELRELQKTNERLVREVEALSIEKIEANKARQLAEASLVSESQSSEELGRLKSQLAKDVQAREAAEAQCSQLTAEVSKKEKEITALREASLDASSVGKENERMKTQIKNLELHLQKKTEDLLVMETTMTSALEQADATVDSMEHKLAVAMNQVKELSAGGEGRG